MVSINSSPNKGEEGSTQKIKKLRRCGPANYYGVLWFWGEYTRNIRWGPQSHFLQISSKNKFWKWPLKVFSRKNQDHSVCNLWFFVRVSFQRGRPYITVHIWGPPPSNILRKDPPILYYILYGQPKIASMIICGVILVKVLHFCNFLPFNKSFQR